MAAAGAAHVAGMLFMPYYNELVKIVEQNTGMKATLTGIFHQAKYSLLGVIVGGIVLGPPGALIGGIIGSIYGYMTVHNYSSLLKVLNTMSEEEKSNMINEVKQLVGSDTVDSLQNFVQNQANRNALFGLLGGFISGQAQNAGFGQQKMHSS